MSTVFVRPAVQKDLEGILSLAAVVVEAPHWKRSDYEAALMGEQEEEGVGRLLVVAEVESALAGFAVAGRVWDEADLESLVVAPAWRRQGVGLMLCGLVADWAREFGVDSLMLEVRLGSSGARALYRKAGFIEDGVRRDYYRDPVDDAVLMRLELALMAGTGHL